MADVAKSTSRSRPVRLFPAAAAGALLFLTIAYASAQSGPQVARPRPAADDQQAEKQDLYHLLDDLRAAIRNDDWGEANRIGNRLNLAMMARRVKAGQVSPSLELAHVEMMAGRDVTTRTPLLPRLAQAAYAARQFSKAEKYAKEALEASRQGDFWWTGDAIHQANIVLGRLAVDRSDMQAAKDYLLAAGKTPGSTQLASFGPNMGLAQRVLASGDSDTVVQYLEECRTFWKTGSRKIAEWLALLRAGLQPDFGSNVDY